MAENFDKQEPAEQKQINTAHLLGDQYKVPEVQKNNVADQAAQVGKVSDTSNEQSADKSEAKQFSPSDLKAASSDPEVTALRSNLGDSAKAIQNITERLGRGPAAPEGQELLKNMMKEWNEHMNGKNVQTGETRGNGQMLSNLVKSAEK
ncbi:MAG: hypothetical protein KA392_17160 [Candidatus Obscuribacter sp.]|nr:hypothetical protein [Candidatus Obscuribacter sp.]